MNQAPDESRKPSGSPMYGILIAILTVITHRWRFHGPSAPHAITEHRRQERRVYQ